MGYILLQVKIDKHKLCFFQKDEEDSRSYVTMSFTCNLVEEKGKGNRN